MPKRFPLAALPCFVVLAAGLFGLASSPALAAWLDPDPPPSEAPAALTLSGFVRQPSEAGLQGVTVQLYQHVTAGGRLSGSFPADFHADSQQCYTLLWNDDTGEEITLTGVWHYDDCTWETYLPPGSYQIGYRVWVYIEDLPPVWYPSSWGLAIPTALSEPAQFAVDPYDEIEFVDSSLDWQDDSQWQQLQPMPYETDTFLLYNSQTTSGSGGTYSFGDPVPDPDPFVVETLAWRLFAAYPPGWIAVSASAPPPAVVLNAVEIDIPWTESGVFADNIFYVDPLYTATPTRTNTATSTRTSTATNTATRTNTATATRTVTPHLTQTAQMGATQTAAAATLTATAWTPTSTHTATTTRTATATRTVTPHLTHTAAAATLTATAWTPTSTHAATATHTATATPGPAVHRLYLPCVMVEVPIPAEVAESEPNDTFAQADDVPYLPAHLTGQHDGSAGSGDVYHFHLLAGQILQANLTTENTAGLQLLLYDIDGHEIARAIAAPYSLEVVAVSTGTYYLYVFTPAEAGNQGQYALSLAAQDSGVHLMAWPAPSGMDATELDKPPHISQP